MLASVVNRGTPSPLVLWTLDRGGSRLRPGPRVARSRPRPGKYTDWMPVLQYRAPVH